MTLLYGPDFRAHGGHAELLAWVRQHGFDPAQVRRCEVVDNEVRVVLYERGEDGGRVLVRGGGDVATREESVPLVAPVPVLPGLRP